MNTLEFIKENKFTVILRHIDPEDILDAVEAAYKGGARLFEITFDPSDSNTAEKTKQMIRTVCDTYGDSVVVGAGTVLNTDLAKAAHEGGAKFIVSPCTNEKVIEYTKQAGMLSMPGAFTPTEIVRAYELGADVVKVFPITPDNIAYLKTVMSPLSHIPFMPTGGVNPDNITEYFKLGAVCVGAGATVVTNELLKNKEYDKITQNTKNHIDKIKSM